MTLRKEMVRKPPTASERKRKAQHVEQGRGKRGHVMRERDVVEPRLEECDGEARHVEVVSEARLEELEKEAGNEEDVAETGPEVENLHELETIQRAVSRKRKAKHAERGRARRGGRVVRGKDVEPRLEECDGEARHVEVVSEARMEELDREAGIDEDVPETGPEVENLHELEAVQRAVSRKRKAKHAERGQGIRGGRVVRGKDVEPLLEECDGEARHVEVVSEARLEELDREAGNDEDVPETGPEVENLHELQTVQRAGSRKRKAKHAETGRGRRGGRVVRGKDVEPLLEECDGEARHVEVVSEARLEELDREAGNDEDVPETGPEVENLHELQTVQRAGSRKRKAKHAETGRGRRGGRVVRGKDVEPLLEECDGEATHEEATAEARLQEFHRQAGHVEDVAQTGPEVDNLQEPETVQRAHDDGPPEHEPEAEAPIVLQDPSLLKDFSNHVAVHIWRGQERPLLTIQSHSTHLKNWPLPDGANGPSQRFLEKVRRSGLFHIGKLSYSYCNKVLVFAFVERWHSETNNFHFRFGEMTITLDDVPRLVGLSVEGLPVHAEVVSREDCIATLQKCLGVTAAVASANIKGGGVMLDWLEDNFSVIGEDDDDERVDCCVRAYLLHLVGSVLFADKTGNRVHVSYIALFEDLTRVRDVAWGAGVLAYLYRQLGQASRVGCKQICGHMTLLDAWIQEHFPMLRNASDRGYTEEQPRATRWLPRREAKSPTTAHYRELLDDVYASQVVFDPYKDCRSIVPDIAFYTGCIRCMNVVEPHMPDRVLRQFGLVQSVPGPPLAPLRANGGASTYTAVYEYTDALWENWRDHLLHENKQTAVTAGVPWESHPDYLMWFRTVSHFRVAPGREEGQIESAEERNAAALAVLDGVLVEPTSLEWQTMFFQVRRILRGAGSVESESSMRSPPTGFTYSRRRSRRAKGTT